MIIVTLPLAPVVGRSGAAPPATGPGPALALPGGALAAQLAAQLAAEVTRAGSAQTRYQALLDVLRAVGIGVYASASGTVIVRGAERDVRDF